MEGVSYRQRVQGEESEVQASTFRLLTRTNSQGSDYYSRRDHDFDLETDKHRCLHGLSTVAQYVPSDVQRVTQIFKKPQFLIHDASYNDIIQGALGDCYFIAALALIRTSGELAYKFCVARDEEIGVYGFIFFRDSSWVTVVIDEYVLWLLHRYAVAYNLFFF